MTARSYGLNATHDPRRQSWVESAQRPGCDFPIQNLPFGIFRGATETGAGRVGIAIGDQILDVRACQRAGLFPGAAATAGEACLGASLNPLMALGGEHWSALRASVSNLLTEDFPERDRAREYLTPMREARLILPAIIGDYSDFYASIFHASNVGSMFRPDNPLMPNYKYLPVGYHARASSVAASGAPVRRPMGQTRPDEKQPPGFGACRLLDYELEMGVFIGPGNELGARIPLGAAERHIFGLCLLNDWSARDIQSWEYQPLGPFLAKSFATTISPWVVTLEALEPFRAAAFARPAGDPEPLPHLNDPRDRERGGFDITLEAFLRSARMRRDGVEPLRLSRANFRDMYWTIAQMTAHHASNGCNLRAGDLLGSGTVSGPEKESRGCLLELTWRGKEPVALPGGESRRFLEDGDEVILRGHCEREGAARIGFGECAGMVEPALP